jgi:hypothetical protein
MGKPVAFVRSEIDGYNSVQLINGIQETLSNNKLDEKSSLFLLI